MQGWIRKYRRQMYIILAILIIPSFVWWGATIGGSPSAGMDGQAGGTPVAWVDDQGIAQDQLAQVLNQEIIQRERTGQEAVTYADLQADGTVDRALEQLLDDALLQAEIAKINLNFERDFLVDLLKEQEFSQNGVLDTQAWNNFVQRARGVNWNSIYDSLAENVRASLAVRRMTAPARVIESDLRKQFEDQHTAYTVEYVAVEPEPTDEQIQAEYDKDPSKYAVPGERRVEFVAIPLAPPRPAELDTIVEQARSGSDFAQLVDEYSDGTTRGTGGLLDWMPVSGAMPAYRQPLAALTVGQVSDPVEGPGGWFIYKLEEERTDEATGERQVRAREILVRPEPLAPEERQARTERAEAIAAQAQETGDLAAAAAEAGVEVRNTGFFTEDTATIQNVEQADTFQFRSQISALDQGEVSPVISTARNLYVAKVAETREPTVQPLEAVRDQVAEAVVQQLQQSGDYERLSADLAETIAAEADSLDAIRQQYPGATTEPAEMTVSIADFDYTQGVFWNPREVTAALSDKEPGALVGPITDFLGKPYFIELKETAPPSEEAWETEWPQQKEQLRQQMLAQRQNAVYSDYLLYLREQAQRSLRIGRDDAAIGEVLGSGYHPDLQGGPVSTELPEESAPTAETPAPVAEEFAPAESPPPAVEESAASAAEEAAPAIPQPTAETPDEAADAAAAPEPEAAAAPAE